MKCSSTNKPGKTKQKQSVNYLVKEEIHTEAQDGLKYCKSQGKAVTTISSGSSMKGELWAVHAGEAMLLLCFSC